MIDARPLAWSTHDREFPTIIPYPRCAAAKASIDAVLQWGQRLGVLRVID